MLLPVLSIRMAVPLLRSVSMNQKRPFAASLLCKQPHKHHTCRRASHEHAQLTLLPSKQQLTTYETPFCNPKHPLLLASAEPCTCCYGPSFQCILHAFNVVCLLCVHAPPQSGGGHTGAAAPLLPPAPAGCVTPSASACSRQLHAPPTHPGLHSPAAPCVTHQGPFLQVATCTLGAMCGVASHRTGGTLVRDVAV